MHFRKLWIGVVSLCLLSSCATSPVENKENKVDEAISLSAMAQANTIELLDFIAIYPELSPETQKTVFAEISQQLTSHPNDVHLRIQQGVMLALPDSVMSNATAAQPVLQTLLDSNELTESDTALVKLLLTLTLEHNKQAIKVREEAKKNEMLKQKNKTLIQKLDDLKNIEKTMIERNTKTNNNP